MLQGSFFKESMIRDPWQSLISNLVSTGVLPQRELVDFSPLLETTSNTCIQNTDILIQPDNFEGDGHELAEHVHQAPSPGVKVIDGDISFSNNCEEGR